MPGAAPSSASASGYSGDPSDTWHNTNTNLLFTSTLPFTELCGTDNAQALYSTRPYRNILFMIVLSCIRIKAKGQETTHIYKHTHTHLDQPVVKSTKSNEAR